jgi:hypothetical protein
MSSALSATVIVGVALPEIDGRIQRASRCREAAPSHGLDVDLGSESALASEAERTTGLIGTSRSVLGTAR